MTDKKPEQKNKRNTLLVRLSPDLHARLKVIADREHRSMSAQVCCMIEATPLPEGAVIAPSLAQDGAQKESKKDPWWKKPLAG